MVLVAEAAAAAFALERSLISLGFCTARWLMDEVRLQRPPLPELSSWLLQKPSSVLLVWRLLGSTSDGRSLSRPLSLRSRWLIAKEVDLTGGGGGGDTTRLVDCNNNLLIPALLGTGGLGPVGGLTSPTFDGDVVGITGGGAGGNRRSEELLEEKLDLGELSWLEAVVS